MLMEHEAFPGQVSVVPDNAVRFQKEKGWREVTQAELDDRKAAKERQEAEQRPAAHVFDSPPAEPKLAGEQPPAKDDTKS